jgi:hypothetical protein
MGEAKRSRAHQDAGPDAHWTTPDAPEVRALRAALADELMMGARRRPRCACRGEGCELAFQLDRPTRFQDHQRLQSYRTPSKCSGANS